MKETLQAIALILLFSCNKIGVSKTEVKAVDKVIEFYGGQVNRAIGFKTKNSTKINYFELKVSQSQLLNSDQRDLQAHAGNIAYLFYSNLKNEKSNYQEIKVQIDLQSGENRTYQFPVSDLMEVEKLMPVINKTNNFIKAEDYKAFATEFSPKYKIDDKALKNLFDELHAKFGEIKEIQFQGFTFAEHADAGSFISVKEVIILEKNAGRMLVNYDRKPQKVLGFSFD